MAASDFGGGTPQSVPEEAYTTTLQVRSYEVGRSGCVRPATVLRYFENLATLASAERGFDHRWYERTGSAWVVRQMRLHLGPLPGIADVLGMATWLSSYARVQAYREYALWRARDGRPIARAQARWAYVSRETGRPQRIPDELISRFGALGAPMPPHRAHDAVFRDAATAAPSAAALDTELHLTARGYEADTNQHINNCVYVDWLEEALDGACGALGIAGSAGAAWRVIPRAYTIEYLRAVVPGEALTVRTRIARAGSRALHAAQQITCDEDGSVALRASALYLHLRRQSH